MPSKSLKQHRLMQAVAESEEFAKRAGIKQSVAREYLKRDKEANLYQYPKESKTHRGWFEVQGFPYFVVNRKGMVKNVKTGYETRGSLDDKGYRRVCQWDNEAKTKKEYKAHVLICTAFHGPKPGDNYEVGHKNHDRADNRPGNLEWVTRKDNMTTANKRRVSVESHSSNSAYVSMKLAEDSQALLFAVQEALGLKNPLALDELHITLLYSQSKGLVGYEPLKGDLHIRSEWEYVTLDNGTTPAIVLKNPGEIQTRHNELLEMGGEHSYPTLLPHVSLSYNDKPTEKQIDNVDWSIVRKLIFTGEYLEPIKDDDGLSMEDANAPTSLFW